MKAEKFNEVVSRRLKIVSSLLKTKGAEYSTDVDRLHNFKRASEILGVTPAKACISFLAKHLVSIMDMVEYGKTPSQAMIDEKFTDAINYFLLLEAVLMEQEAETK